MPPWRISGVLLPIIAWLEWKKPRLLCQGLLNQDDLNLWGHEAGTSGEGLEGDKWQVVGRSRDVPEIEKMCAALDIDR